MSTATSNITSRAPNRRRLWLVTLGIVVLLTQMTLAMTTTARQQSQTADEGVYIAAAVTYLQQRDLRYNPEHPPLAKLVMAAGLIFADAQTATRPDWSQWQLGRDILYRHDNGAQRLLWLARLPMIVLALLFGLVVFAFARDLTGSAGGLLALALYSFSPDVIAYGSLAGIDAPKAGFLLTTVWLLWRARSHPWRYLPLAALAFGAALATKMSALAAVPVVLLLAALSMWSARGDTGRMPRLLTAAGAAVGVGVLATATVWLTYLVVDPGLRWTPPMDLPVIHGLAGKVADWLPFPQPFRDGMLVQFALERKQFSGFLLGEAYTGHRWYYLPAALLIKTPLGTLALWTAGITVMLAIPRLRAAALYVLLPVAVMLAVAMQGSRDWGVRYALFVPVFLAVAAAAVVQVKRRSMHVMAALLVAFVAVSSLRAYPYYLPYSNEAFGGPSNTYLRLGDSNVDWGQDLYRLAIRLRQYPGERVWLVHRNQAAASYYGIDAADPLRVSAAEVDGLLAVSATRLAVPSARLKALTGRGVRIDDVGHSIVIYRLPSSRIEG